ARLPQVLKRAAKDKSREEKTGLDEAALSQRAEDSSKVFESQKRKQEEHDRKQEQHKMKKDLHQWAVTFAEAKVYHQQTLTDSLKTLQDIAKLKANS
ncbi:MAG TPA: hypothetical protein VGK64_13100, partial [Bryobacteraceae bacterium]